MGSAKRRPSNFLQRYRERRKNPTWTASNQNLIIQLLDTARRDPKRTALLGSAPGMTGPVSYRDLMDRVEKLSSALLKLGIRKGDRVAILSPNRPEWTIADFSIMAVGAVTVPIYTTQSPAQMARDLKHSRSKLLFVSNGPHLEPLRTVSKPFPHLKHLVSFDEILSADFPFPRLSLQTLMELGQADRRPLEILASRIAPEDPATIVYTTGAGADPRRAVLLTHQNLLAEKKALEQFLPIHQGTVLLSFLPLAHILQRVVDMAALLGEGQLAYCPDINQVEEMLREVRPHLIVGVPRTYEKIRDTLLENLIYSDTPFKEIYQRLFQWMERDYEQRKQGKRLPTPMQIPMRWLKGSALHRIRERLGGRIQFCFCAGAPLPRDLEIFFEIVQIPLFNVYGMTELTGAVAANRPGCHRTGTVGTPLPGCEIRIGEGAEILVRGETVTPGTYQPARPVQPITDAEGWLATGDLGQIDADGFLTITGRKKEILITAAGKNVAPRPIESKLCRNPYIRQAVVIGDRRKYLTALIVPVFRRLEEFAVRERVLCPNKEELLNHPKVRGLYGQIIAEVNRGLARFETVKGFALLSEPFTRESGELIPAQGLQRDVIERRYKEEIENLY